MDHPQTPADPVPQETARLQARYDTDPDALAWARAKIQHYIGRLAKFEDQATASNSSNKARGLRVARRVAERTLIGGGGCVVGAFDARRPEMFVEASPAPDTTAVDGDPTARLQAAIARAFAALIPGSDPANLTVTITEPLPGGGSHNWAGSVTGLAEDVRQAVAVVVLPLIATEREIGRINGLGEGADIAERLPTPDNCGEMSSFDGAWDSGTYAVAAALRARADEIDQQPTVFAGAEPGGQS